MSLNCSTSHVPRESVSAVRLDKSKHRHCAYVCGSKLQNESKSGTENEICAIIDNIYKYLCSMQAFRRAVYKSPADSPFTIHHSPSALPLSSLDQYKWASEQ